MCGCIGTMILIGSAFYLWDGLTSGHFGPSSGFALAVMGLGVISIWGWFVSNKRR